MTSHKLANAKLFISIVASFYLLSSLAPAWAIQCAPYARDISGINLYGAAWTWWGSASGRYQRGKEPRIGSALVFKRLKGMPSGHVAVVTRLVSARMIEVSRANWAHHGRAGNVETDAAVFDESPTNDWSQVRVWYSPVQNFGAKIYPTYGFIYPPETVGQAIDRHDTES